jgi:hypothetical protein
MKYFSTLPTKTFSSSIGNFTICDFFSHYEINTPLAQTQKVVIDDHTTLVEFSQNIYQDNNSIWLFLLANNYIDPFDLAAYSVSLYLANNKNKLSTSLSSDPEILVPPISVAGAASIITEYIGSTSGKKWEYSSVGNFSLTGGFALVESSDYYTGKSVLKKPQVNDFITATSYDELSVINKPISGSSYYVLTDGAVDAFGTVNKVPVTEAVAVQAIPDAGSIILAGDSDYPTLGFATPPPPATNTGDGATLTNLQYVTGQNENIKVFVPGKLSGILSNLISFK